jgi:hypothetical protein
VGLTPCHFLAHESVVCLEPRPCRFKVGEAISPDQFDHPRLLGIAERARELPSYAEKWGSIIVFDHSAAAYPVSARGAELALHIRRDELEALLIEAWRPPLRAERSSRSTSTASWYAPISTSIGCGVRCWIARVRQWSSRERSARFEGSGTSIANGSTWTCTTWTMTHSTPGSAEPIAICASIDFCIKHKECNDAGVVGRPA